MFFLFLFLEIYCGAP